MYHCAYMDWTESTWTGTYLSFKENSQRTSSYTVIQDITGSDPVHPTDSETLQCSILSTSENTTCSEEPSVFWFRAISDTSHPDIIYTDGNCEKTSNNQKKCSYKVSNVSSSEADTYYCAVATCGQILFGNGTNLVKSSQESSSSQPRHREFSKPQDGTENGQDQNYAALHFSRGKPPGVKKKREPKTEESVYSQLKG
ncbi:hypothetical protein ATANTOWER_017649 [Ataeniobius toweri]|uniref:Ig-like domain-containing protein n=1 Tax=Ataeniobius toweri TaxID=208326 RepID=A0ABU7BZ78_9TELE|nr:hypothetical protein [Ataeniobius toweri]